ncbi:MAG: hypothetical protein WD401_04655 [Thermomicrobiaceae bacterium]
MIHLSTEQWWREFVPAEVERLRGEVSAIGQHDWVVHSGLASIEQLARAGYLASSNELPVARPEPLLDSINGLKELHQFADPRPPAIQPSDGVVKRLKRFLSRFSGRLYAEELYWQQRQFNDAVVRAFEAQDRLNREHAVQQMFALILIGEVRSGSASSTAEKGEIVEPHVSGSLDSDESF